MADDDFVPITEKMRRVDGDMDLPRVPTADLGSAGGPVEPGHVPVPPEGVPSGGGSDR